MSPLDSRLSTVDCSGLQIFRELYGSRWNNQKDIWIVHIPYTSWNNDQKETEEYQNGMQECGIGEQFLLCIIEIKF